MWHLPLICPGQETDCSPAPHADAAHTFGEQLQRDSRAAQGACWDSHSSLRWCWCLAAQASCGLSQRQSHFLGGMADCDLVFRDSVGWGFVGVWVMEWMRNVVVKCRMVFG